MKKINLLILAVSISFGLDAQFTNNGFEEWSDNTLNWWTTNNNKASSGTIDYGGEAVENPVEKVAGLSGFAAQLTSFEVIGGGPINDGLHGATIEQQLLDHATQYDSISFYIKYNTANNDQAYINITAMPASGWTPALSIHKYYSGSQSSWQKIVIPFNYTDVPNSLSFILTSSEREVNPMTSLEVEKGSWFIIDDIKLYADGEETLNLNKLIAQQTKIYPNPATNILNFEGDYLENGKLIIHSILGEEMLSTALTSGTNSIDVSQFNRGVYLYSLMNAKGEVIKTDKVIISK